MGLGIKRRLEDRLRGGRTRLQKGDAAPEWGVVAVPSGETVRLGQLEGWKVLYFYPKADTPGCTRQACSLRDANDRLQAAGVSVYGASTDHPDSLSAFRGKYNLNFPLLSDPDGQLARRYGVLTSRVGSGTARRVTFIIDPQGRVATVLKDVDTSQHGEEVLSILSGLGAV